VRRGTPSPADLAGLQAALRLARAAAVREEIPVGAVVVSNGRRPNEVIARVANRMVRDKDATAHAELLAVQRALRAARTDRLPDATLYVTLEPCAQCAGAIILAKVDRVVYGAADARCGMAGSVYDLLRHPRLNHRPEVVGGLMAEECGDLLKRFFSERR
jgi:tRNA(adenine34) deaminase